MQIRRLLALAVVSSFVLAACGGGSSNKNTAGNNSPSATNVKSSGGGGSGSADACAFVTQADATALFGVAAQKTDDVTGNATSALSTCIWKADDAEQHSYLLQVRIYGDTYHLGIAQLGFSPLDGIGDKAVIAKSDGLRGVDVQFLKNGKTYTVNYGITNVLAKTKKSAVAQADQLVAMVKQDSGRV